MSTHSDGLYGALSNTLEKIKTLVYLESAIPAVDQPVDEVDKSEMDVVVSLHHYGLVQQLPSFLLYYVKQVNKQNNKRGK
jgi:hypothetical protein